MELPPSAMTPNPLIKPRRWRRAFSLVEVVVAVGVFAIAIVAVIGLVAALTRNVTEVTDTDDASRLVTNLQGKLQSVSFQDLRNYMGDVTAKSAANRIYANRDGSRVGLGSATAVWDPDNSLNTAEENAQKYFLVEMLPNNDLSPASNDNTAGFLAFTVRLIYPAYLGNGDVVTDSSQQSTMLVPVAVTR